MDGTLTFWLDGHVSLEPLDKCPRIFLHTRFWWATGREFLFLEVLWWGNRPLCSQFLGLYRVVTVENITIFAILVNCCSFSLNLKFRHNLTNLEIENFETLLSPLTCLHLSQMRELDTYPFYAYS